MRLLAENEGQENGNVHLRTLCAIGLTTLRWTKVE
jgi:hypothetical protein